MEALEVPTTAQINTMLSTLDLAEENMDLIECPLVQEKISVKDCKEKLSKAERRACFQTECSHIPQM